MEAAQEEAGAELGSRGSNNLASASAKWVAIGPTPVTGGQTLDSKCHVEISGRATSIAVNPKNPNDVTNTSSLPDVPANTIHIFPGNPSVLLVGTDIGIFRSKNRGATWEPYMGSGSFRLPNVPVYEIAIDEDHGRIIAGTHGRGAFVVEEELGFNPWELACPVPCLGATFSFLDDPVDPTQDISVELSLLNGQVVASGNRDAQGNRIEVGPGGIVETVSPSGDRHPGFWASFNGVGVGGADLSSVATAANPIAQIAVNVAGTRSTRQLGDSAAVLDPPSATLGLPSLSPNGLVGGPGQGGAGGVPGGGSSLKIQPMLVEEGGSMRVLCEALVPYDAADSAESLLLRAMGAINANTLCEHPLRAPFASALA